MNNFMNNGYNPVAIDKGIPLGILIRSELHTKIWNQNLSQKQLGNFRNRALYAIGENCSDYAEFTNFKCEC